MESLKILFQFLVNLISVYGDGLSYFADWPNVCHLLWYPYHLEKCGEARCMACAPAMMASAQVSNNYGSIIEGKTEDPYSFCMHNRHQCMTL